MTVVIFPGSFDPITLGHEDLIRRAAQIYDTVIVAIGRNSEKNYLFDDQSRYRLVLHSLGELPNVRVVTWAGLTSDLALQYGAKAIIKGIRNASDAESELIQAQANQALSKMETVFLPTSPDKSFISSSLVKEIAHYGGKLEGMVSPHVAQALRERHGVNTGNLHKVDPS